MAFVPGSLLRFATVAAQKAMPLPQDVAEKRAAGEGWESETDLSRLAMMCEAINAEAQLRQAYLNDDCDKIMEDLCGNAQTQRKIHEGAVRGAKKDFKACLERLKELQRRQGKEREP